MGIILKNQKIISYICGYNFKITKTMNFKKLMGNTVADNHKVKDAKDSTGDKMREALSILNTIKNSGYIPFSSPSPSSTEMIVKKSINNAIASLYDALEAHNDLYVRK